MNRILLILSVLLYLPVSAQTSEKYNSEYENFYRAEELFEKEQYAAARKEFRIFIDGFPQPNDPMYIKASYYEAISALELYNNDALTLLLAFNKNYPESIYKKDIYFRLGRHFYYKKKYEDALVWFNKLSIQDVEPENQDEFYFKLGYANFKEENFDAARNAFYEIKDGVSQYAAPALYYYSHIAYQNENYELALEGFLKLEDHEKFGKFVPYYIAQIYYLQGKYDQVMEYVPKITSEGGIVNEKEMNLLIGDAYYRTGKFDEAVPFLEKYNRASKTTREEDYRLGYAYYKSGHYDEAVRTFDRVNREEDSLGQMAYYHIGECMLKLENKSAARTAFEEAAFIEADPIVQEDALYNYAILSYQLDINPYDEAVEAFELYLNNYPNSERKEDVYQYLVNVYTSTNNYAKALVSLDKLPNKDIRLKQAYQLIAYNQGVARFQKNSYKMAIQSFELVKKYPIDPSISGMAVYWTADAHYRLNEFDDAIANYKKFSLLPSTTAPGLKPEAHYNIGYAYLSKADVVHNKMSNHNIGSTTWKQLKSQRFNYLKKSREAFSVYVQSDPPGEQKQADALMRIADAYFVMSENAQAVNFYQKAFNIGAGYEDQALFFMARTYGYMSGKSGEKISNLLNIINNYKDSKYLIKSIHEVAETYKSEGKYDKALKYYNKLVYDYPESNLLVDARINVADIHFKQGKTSAAESEYYSILADHGSDQTVCKRATSGLIDLYKATRHPEKIEELAAQYACAQFSSDEKENLYYLPAIETYTDSTKTEQVRYTEAIPLFEKYLNKFPTGRYKNEVQNYMANCHYVLGNIEMAVSIYRETLDGPVTGFTVPAAVRVSKYLYNENQFEEAIPYYRILETASSEPEVQFNAKLGLMRSHFQIENYQNAALYANKVLKSSNLNNDLKREGHYARGMSNFYLEHYNDAKPSLMWIKDNVTTEMGAEARYSLGESHFKQGNLTSADAEVDGLLKMKPMYNYWVAKGLMLRTRVQMQQDKLFEAEQTLKSVIDHYPNTDDGIQDEASALWDELMQLKDQPKNIEEEGERVIEIGN